MTAGQNESDNVGEDQCTHWPCHTSINAHIFCRVHWAKSRLMMHGWVGPMRHNSQRLNISQCYQSCQTY